MTSLKSCWKSKIIKAELAWDSTVEKKQRTTVNVLRPFTKVRLAVENAVTSKDS